MAKQAQRARRLKADIIIFPEMSLTGYTIRDLAYELAEKHNVCALVHSEDGKIESKECSPEDHPGILEVFFMNLKMYFNRL